MGVRGFQLAIPVEAAAPSDRPVLAALHAAIPPAAIHAAIAVTGAQEQRRRRLPTDLVIALAIGLGLWARGGLREVCTALLGGLRSQDPTAYAAWRAPAKSALPDTGENARLFGRPTTSHGSGALATTAGAFPHVRAVALIESGAHVLCAAAPLRPDFRGEAPAARQLPRSVGPGMLVLWDCGLHRSELLRATQAWEADFLGRVGKAIVLTPEAAPGPMGRSWPRSTRPQQRAASAGRVQHGPGHRVHHRRSGPPQP